MIQSISLNCHPRAEGMHRTAVSGAIPLLDHSVCITQWMLKQVQHDSRLKEVAI